MPRFRGKLGYVYESVETHPGIWEDVVVERYYNGEVIKNRASVQSEDKIIDNITLNNQFSIIADAYLNNHLISLRYVEYLGYKWKVTAIEPNHPRLLVTVGGVYNGPNGNQETGT